MSVAGERRTRQRRRRWRLPAATLGLAILCFGGSAWYVWSRPSGRSAERRLDEARLLRSKGENRRAERRALAALDADSTLGEAALLAAKSAAAQNRFRRAVEHANRMNSADPQMRLRAALLKAKLNHHRLYRLSRAESAYRAALAIDPDNIEANTGLAKLLGLCGRRFEAIPHILRLVRRGHNTDLLIMLGRNRVIVKNPDLLERARNAAPDDPNPLIGLAWHASESGNGAQAIDLLRQAVALDPGHAAAHVALGRELLKAGRFDELLTWARSLPPSADKWAETWLVRGRMAENGGNKKAAIRCYWEAARRQPALKAPNSRLAQLLARVGHEDTAERFAERVRRIIELETVQDRFVYTTDYLLELVKSYEKVGRLWEAYGWCRLAVARDSSHGEARRRLEELQRKVKPIPLRLTADSANVARTVDLSMYPLPRFRESTEQSPPPEAVEAAGSTQMSFRDDGSSAGLRFRYFNGTAGPPTRRMFEFTGGGIGVLDFDRDGFSDVYFSQGRPWPPNGPAGEYRDRLFRNRGGRRFEDVTSRAGFGEDGFGQGVSIGDFNADGFPDLYVAQIGRNQLWRNNGDGTFSDVTEEAGLEADDWTTSCVLADLNSDGLPDIYDVNYVTGEDVFNRICRHSDGNPRLCLPFEFSGQPDRLWLNDGAGGYVDVTADALSVKPDGKGLGVAVWNADGSGRLSVFVANDTTPNFFFVPASGSGQAGSQAPFRLREYGIPSGLGLNGAGQPEGCMGIALGDVDNNGRIDLHVTNFLVETNTFYRKLSERTYQDRTQRMGLHAPSTDTLGFGTQFLDANLDGQLELFVSNGHVDDLRRYGRPYRMAPQFFQRHTAGFVEVDAGELGPYFQKQWLGRAAARIDWNRDGRNDLVVGHLDDDSSLLTNTSRRDGRFLALRLFGVQSNRDAIGTTVEARIGDRRIVRQLTAGDGYQASNERRVILGAGEAETIDRLTVRWPSGRVQHFKNIALSREVWLPEGGPLFQVSVPEF